MVEVEVVIQRVTQTRVITTISEELFLELEDTIGYSDNANDHVGGLVLNARRITLLSDKSAILSMQDITPSECMYGDYDPEDA